MASGDWLYLAEELKRRIDVDGGSRFDPAIVKQDRYLNLNSRTPGLQLQISPKGNSPQRQLSVECCLDSPTVKDGNFFEKLRQKKPDLESRVGESIVFEGRREGRKRSIIRVQPLGPISAPQHGSDISEIADWALPHLYALHDAIEAHWPDPAGGRTTSNPQQKFTSSDRVEPDRPSPYVPRSTPPPQVTAQDNDATIAGWLAHEALVGRIHELAADNGLRPAHGGNPDVDVWWESAQGRVIVEVKSSTPDNEATQVRLALGQVIDYRHSLSEKGAVRAFVALTGTTNSKRWRATCLSVDVGYVEEEDLADLIL